MREQFSSTIIQKHFPNGCSVPGPEDSICCSKTTSFGATTLYQDGHTAKQMQITWQALYMQTDRKVMLEISEQEQTIISEARKSVQQCCQSPSVLVWPITSESVSV